jgi:hypothetical protein
VVVAGFALTFASFVLVFLVWSRGKEIIAKRRETKWQEMYAPGPVLRVYGQTVQDEPENEPTAVAAEPAPQACAAKAGK